jgi:hypothetical protein
MIPTWMINYILYPGSYVNYVAPDGRMYFHITKAHLEYLIAKDSQVYEQGGVTFSPLVHDVVETQEEYINRRIDAMLKSRDIDYSDPFHPVRYLDRETLIDLVELLMSFMEDGVQMAGDAAYLLGCPIQDLTVEQLRKLYLYLYHEYGGTTA